MPVRLNDPKSLEEWIVKVDQRLRELEARRLDAGTGTQIDYATKQVSAKISDDPNNAATIGEDGGILATDTVTSAADHTPLYIQKFMTGNTVVNNNTDTQISWSSATVQGNWTHNATSITIPEDGNYFIVFSWQWANAAAGARGLKVVLNAGTVPANAVLSNTTGNPGGITAAAIECAHGIADSLSLTAGDVLSAWVYQNSGAALGGGAPYFGGIRGQFTVFKIHDSFPPELTTDTATTTA